ncbi:peptide ABC transporter permease [candidate division KSB3 bacterium]|uniref:Peptide ABC transporter permease n=1 Tax=candidate division KSB3 bacterium TaxID=2044937 RepID=A0A2G6E5J0_9BACT|nr:MAG: peptide ABC transporter permease [candidate division KSB3 bacterium]PIE29861.1 MAG: peptide ABC transporter permease [candidate division KSB3 bacterium]
MTELSQKRFRKFKRIKRGYYSLLLISVCYLLSFGMEFIASNKAILVSYEGHYYFPTFTYIPETRFGGNSSADTEYRRLQRRFRDEDSDNYVLMPPIPYGPNESLRDLPGYPPNRPSWAHPLGTDDRGRDVLVRLLYGFRISMSFALQVTALSLVLGIVIGALQGYYGGRFDIVVQRLIEIWSTIPTLYLLIIITSIFEPNYYWLISILTLFGWMGMTYYVRGEMYREKSKDYVQAAKALGASDMRIIFKHILPNSLIPIITLTPFALVGNIFALTALDFLGFGLPAPTPSWGELMSQGTANIYSYWLSLSPIGALFMTLLLVTFIGEAIREAFDPKTLNSLIHQ